MISCGAKRRAKYTARSISKRSELQCAKDQKPYQVVERNLARAVLCDDVFKVTLFDLGRRDSIKPDGGAKCGVLRVVDIEVESEHCSQWVRRV